MDTVIRNEINFFVEEMALKKIIMRNWFRENIQNDNCSKRNETRYGHRGENDETSNTRDTLEKW